MKELSTRELVLASPAALRETGSTVDRLRYSGHVRISWPLNAAFTAMIGFATLLIGAFSRNGLWRQILVAIALLLVLYLVHIVMLSRGPSLSGGWILAYATPALGAAICYGVLWYSGRPRKTRANAANANGQPSAVSP